MPLHSTLSPASTDVAKTTLVTIKRHLLSARIEIANVASIAEKANASGLSGRLRDIDERIANELYLVNWSISRLP